MDANRGRTRTLLWLSAAFVGLCAAAALVWIYGGQPPAELVPAPEPIEVESEFDGPEIPNLNEGEDASGDEG